MKDVGAEYFSDLDTTWSWVVMVACFLTHFVIGGTNFTVGMVHTTLLEKYSGGQANTALVVALHTSISNLGGRVPVFKFTFFLSVKQTFL